MESDVHPSDEHFDDDIRFPPQLTALKCDSIAPPEITWFHGYLDRQDAEYLLSRHSAGTYLVRISIPSTKYVLSVKTNYSYQHFKIKTILGEYYINIYKFPTLSSIIGYFSQVSPLLAGLFLKTPLSPKRPVSRERRLKAKASYTPHPEDDSPEVLSFKKGEIFITDDILDEDDSRWIRARRDTCPESGLIMRVLVQEIAHDEELYAYEWFHGRISDAMVIDILRNEDEGKFVISNSGTSDYCMHVKTGSDIKSTQIFKTGKTGDKYMMGNEAHDTLPECVEAQRKVNSNLSHVKRKSTKSSQRSLTNLVDRRVSYGGTITSYTEDKISANWRPAHAKDWKPIKIKVDRENAVRFYSNSDKKGGKLGERPEKYIDLYRVYEVDRNMYNRDNVLQIVERAYNTETQSHYIEIENTDKYRELCSKLQHPPSPVDNGPKKPGKRVKNLRVKVCQVDGLTQNLVGPVYCTIGFDGASLQRTHDAHNSKKLCWNATLNCRHNNICRSKAMVVKLWYNKNKKNCELEAEPVDLTDMPHMTFDTRYSSLYNKGQKIEGKLKLELYYRDHVVLQSAYYHNLVNELQRSDFRCVKLLKSLVWEPKEKRETFASVLLSIFDKTKVHLIKEMICDEINCHPNNDAHAIFRDNTVTTSLIRTLLDAPASQYYHDKVFNRLVAQLKSSNQVNPGITLEEQKSIVLSVLTDSITECPEDIRTIVTHVIECLTVRWPQDAVLQSSVMHVLMFLRFYLVRLANPNERDLCTMESETATLLKNIARTIKRKDITSYLAHFRQHVPTEQPTDTVLEDLSGLNADDSAHLLHIISTVLNTPDNIANSPESLNNLCNIVKHLHQTEKEID